MSYVSLLGRPSQLDNGSRRVAGQPAAASGVIPERSPMRVTGPREPPANPP